MSIRIMTAWYRDGEFNHVSFGFHPDHLEPAYVSDEQRKAWLNQAWRAKPATLRNGVLYV